MRGNGVPIEPAKHLSPLATGADHLRLAKDAEVPAHPWLTDLTEICQLGHAHLGRRGEPLDDQQSRRIGEPLEIDGQVTRADGDASRERTPRGSRWDVRTHKGIFHKGSLMNVSRSRGWSATPTDHASGASSA